MSDGVERELTLDEWMERLPPIHLARRELDALRARLAAAEAGITDACERMCTECAAGIPVEQDEGDARWWHAGPDGFTECDMGEMHTLRALLAARTEGGDDAY